MSPSRPIPVAAVVDSPADGDGMVYSLRFTVYGLQFTVYSLSSLRV